MKILEGCISNLLSIGAFRLAIAVTNMAFQLSKTMVSVGMIDPMKHGNFCSSVVTAIKDVFIEKTRLPDDFPPFSRFSTLTIPNWTFGISVQTPCSHGLYKLGKTQTCVFNVVAQLNYLSCDSK
jgi:hypothetical protein